MNATPGARALTFFGTTALIALLWVPLMVVLEDASANDINNPFFAFCCFNGLAIYCGTVSFAIAIIAEASTRPVLVWLLIGFLAVVALHGGSVFAIHRANVGGRLRDSLSATAKTFFTTARYSFVSVAALSVLGAVFVKLTFLPDLFVLWPLGAFFIGIWSSRYWLALPAMTCEPIGCLAALRRSRDLTKGIRVRILGLVFLFVVGSIAVFAATLIVLGDEVPAPVYAVAGAMIGTGRALLQARLYRDRVRLREVPSTDELDRIFE